MTPSQALKHVLPIELDRDSLGVLIECFESYLGGDPASWSPGLKPCHVQRCIDDLRAAHLVDDLVRIRWPLERWILARLAIATRMAKMHDEGNQDAGERLFVYDSALLSAMQEGAWDALAVVVEATKAHAATEHPDVKPERIERAMMPRRPLTN